MGQTEPGNPLGPEKPVFQAGTVQIPRLIAFL